MLLRAVEAFQNAPSSSSNGSGVISSFSGLRKIETTSVAFYQLMSEEGHEEEAVINSAVTTLASKRKHRIHLAKAIIENEVFIPMLPCHYEKQMYIKLQHKFCPSYASKRLIYLQQLATMNLTG
jgi:hypothetical protein